MLIGLQPSGPGFVVAFIGIAGLGLRVPRRTAVIAGGMVLIAAGITEAYSSAEGASGTISIVLGAGFLLLTSAFAAASQESHTRSLELLRQEEATRAAREEAAALAERGRLARELHDVLAHTLSGLSLQLEGARLLAEKTSADPRLIEQISHAGQLAREGLNGAKRAVSTLRGDALPSPADIPSLVDNACRSRASRLVRRHRRASCPCRRDRARDLPRRPGGTDQHLEVRGPGRHRVGHADLDRVVGHGRGVDSGGPPAVAALPSGGFGLAGLGERAALAGGELDAGPVGAAGGSGSPCRCSREVRRVIRVLIADDQKVVRDGLAMLLGLLDDITVVGTAVDGADAVRQAADLDPDVVLMDLNMPTIDGVEATRQLVSKGSRPQVVVLTTYADDDSVFRALQAGARGFLTKDAGAEEIQRALVAVAADRPASIRPCNAACWTPSPAVPPPRWLRPYRMTA